MKNATFVQRLCMKALIRGWLPKLVLLGFATVCPWVLPPIQGGARNYMTLTTSVDVALVAATAKTVVQLVAATNVRVAIQTITVSFDGTSNTAEPVTVIVRRQTTAGTATARAPLKKDDDIATALSSTGQENFTAEPTDSDILLTYLVHPQAGVQYPLPLPGELIIGSGDRIGVKMTAPAGVNTSVTVEAEE